MKEVTVMGRGSGFGEVNKVTVEVSPMSLMGISGVDSLCTMFVVRLAVDGDDSGKRWKISVETARFESRETV